MNELIIVLHILFLLSALLTAGAVFFLKDMIAAAISFGAFSFFLALEFLILQAPDVAIAEAAIGAAISTVILIIAIRATKREEADSND